MMWGYYDGMGWGMLFGGIWSILFLAAIIWLVIWSVNRVGGAASQAPRHEDPLDIAKRRLARGEIDQEAFEALKKALQ